MEKRPFYICSNIDQPIAGLHSTVSKVYYSRSKGQKFKYQLSHLIFVELDHVILSTIILHLPLIQEGQLSVTGESICTNNV